jgi:hypothetical protein
MVWEMSRTTNKILILGIIFILAIQPVLMQSVILFQEENKWENGLLPSYLYCLWDWDNSMQAISGGLCAGFLARF